MCCLRRERLKSEKQELVNTVEALSKRVRHLEHRSNTGAQLHVERPVSPAVSESSPATNSPATTPSEGHESPALVANKSRRSQLDQTLSDALRDVSMLFGLNHCIQCTSTSVTAIDISAGCLTSSHLCANTFADASLRVVESSINNAASNLSVLLDALPAAGQSSKPKQSDLQLDVQDVDPVTANLMLREIQTFVDHKSQLRARSSGKADLAGVCMHEQEQRELPQQHDDGLLHVLTELIKAGMRHCEPNLHGSSTSSPDAAMATDARLEQLVVYRKAYVATARKLMLNRKACYAELNQLAQLQLDRTASQASSRSDSGSQTKQVNGGVGGDETSARAREFQALSSATERLQRSVTDNLKLIEEFGDSAMLEIFPPIVR